ncbi:MAG: methyl-accepting chemotaxis protein [Desulfuromonadales bacterium]
MFNNMKIGMRLGLGFGLVLLLLVLQGAMGIRGMGNINEDLKRIVTVQYANIKLTSDINSKVTAIIDETEQMTLKNQAGRIESKKEIDKLRLEYAVLMDKLEKLDKNDKAKDLLATAKTALESSRNENNNVIELSLANKTNEAMDELQKNAAPLNINTKSAFKTAVQYQEERMQVRYADASSDFKQSKIIALAITAAALLMGALISFFVTRSITSPIHRMRVMIQDIAEGEGDLTKCLDASAKDELGEVSRWFNTFIDKLHGIISQISSTSDQVASASNQLNSTAEQIATGAEEVAAQSGTVATAGEEMSATSSDIARNCQLAADGADRASQAAKKGAAVVDSTVVVMSQINARVQESALTVESLGQRSDQIGAIIGTIEDIADQTNLLALNAAIEAARAGEQGRGFAVVADEVRALAERTTRATKEIGEMIKAIQKETKGAVTAMEQGVREVEAGTAEAARSGEALRDILLQVNDVTMQVNQIATAAEEQTATTSEISSNMQQITDVVRQTAQGAAESATAAAQLNGNAEELQRLVRQFKLFATTNQGGNRAFA